MTEIVYGPYQVPQTIEFNEAEILTFVQNKVALYTDIVYDSPKEAKKDRAELNRTKTLLNDERKRIKAELLKPYESVEIRFAKIMNIIDSGIAKIDEYIKAEDEKKKEQKRSEIEEMFTYLNKFGWLSLNKIWNSRWLNATYKLTEIEGDINKALVQISEDISTLESLPEYGFEATEYYKKYLDMNGAIAKAREIKEIQTKKAVVAKNAITTEEHTEVTDQATVAESETVEAIEEVWTLTFETKMNRAQMLKFKEFFDVNNIEYKLIDSKKGE